MQNDKTVVKQFQEAKRLAHLCMARERGLPDSAAIHALAYAILTCGLAKGADEKNAVDHAGADKDQNEMLDKVYGD